MNPSCLCSHRQEVTTSNSSNIRNASIDGCSYNLIQPRSEQLQSTSDTAVPPSRPPEGHSYSTSQNQPESSTPSSHQKMDDCTMFNSFNFWRPPLPDITQDLWLLQGEKRDVVKEKEETMRGGKENLPSLDAQGPATSSQIQKVLDCLQPHLDDPDVQGDCEKSSCSFALFRVGNCSYSFPRLLSTRSSSEGVVRCAESCSIRESNRRR